MDHSRDKGSERAPEQIVVKRRNMPSLGAFATFEVAAKHLSFTLAASELHVTQAAISQQIRGLERELDCRLFLRKHNAVELTLEGHTLLEAVTRGLDSLTDAIVRIGQRSGRKVVTVSGTHAIISHYVKPLTDKFRATAPDVRFTLLASDENDRMQDFEEVDLSVIYGNERSEIGPHLIALCPEIVDPVCSPTYLKTHTPIGAPRDLADAPLMALHRMHWSADAIAWYPISWSDWFRHHAPEVEEPSASFISNSYCTLVDAAERGQGLILGWRHLVQNSIMEGRLVRIPDVPIVTGRTIYLKVNRSNFANPQVERFIEFLRRENVRIGLSPPDAGSR